MIISENWHHSMSLSPMVRNAVSDSTRLKDMSVSQISTAETVTEDHLGILGFFNTHTVFVNV